MAFVAWLQGKKTYLVAISAGIVLVLQTLGVIDDNIAKTILSFLGVTGAITLRAGLKK